MDKDTTIQEDIEKIDFRFETVMELALKISSTIQENNLMPLEEDLLLKIVERTLNHK